MQTITATTERLQISKGNSKIGEIASVSLTPIVSCPDGVPCSKLCYAVKAYRRFPHVKAGRDGNLSLWQQKPETFESMLIAFLETYKGERFRYHVSGDIPDTHYIDMMQRVAISFPAIQFYAYTKAFHLFSLDTIRNVCSIDNLVIIASEWIEPSGFVSWVVPDAIRQYFPVATVDHGNGFNALDRDAVLHCPGSCIACKICSVVKSPYTVVFPIH